MKKTFGRTYEETTDNASGLKLGELQLTNNRDLPTSIACVKTDIAARNL
jgi:hypothetical protein